MNKRTTKTFPLFSILIILLITILVTSTKPQPIELTIPESPILEITTVQQIQQVTNSILEPTPVPTETPYPKPTYVPTLRPYDIDKSHDIWHAKDPSSYITPNNEWVKYYANHTDLVQIQYVPDTKDNLNDDYWQNADYTLYTMQGDCEDEAIVWVSIHRALGHKAVVVAGDLWFYDGTPNIRDYWYEWVDESGFINKKFVTSITQIKEFKAVPKYMFNNEIKWSKYNEK